MASKTSDPILAPPEIHALVAKFAEHQEQYKKGDYNETQLRRDFLDPFFAAMGWDIDNRKGYAEKYREVIHEDALRVEQSVRAPDYCFRVGGQRQFFVEAKKPAVNIKQDPLPAFQLRRYAWTAKLPLSILTDFEEFAVYDCRIKPDQNDKSSVGRVMLLKYTDYVEKWHELTSIFSYEAINRGAFDKYAESNKKKRGTAEVDEAFLEEIESWREALAKNLSRRNQQLTDRELNTAVQLIIDRIIFLRMCEGRGIEPFGRLQALLNGETVYPRLVELFHRADEKYNSGLFHFQAEKGRDEPDLLTTDLVVDDKPLKDILKRLYYPDSPYEFAALPADILGQVYEQFLGKVIRLTKSHQAKIEEKPEVRKAGGVYYTPTYIVDYIVENTIGKLLEGRTPQQVGGLTKTYQPAKTGRPLSVLDPACGSGSFLIVAYQYLLDWYLKQYTEVGKPEKHAAGKNPRIYQKKGGDWTLTTPERKRILLAHIYGVDIDYQACEVTKLSLLLKVLEGETEETLQRQLFSKERALPDLANNIKCGNSLIGPDFYQDQQGQLFDEEETLRINAFDWKTEFPHIFSKNNPGFDAVVGNPPYVDIKGMPELDVKYLAKSYLTADNRINLFAIFVERCLQLVNAPFRFSMIVPTSLLAQSSYKSLRNLVLNSFSLSNLIRLPNESFGSSAGEVKVDTVIFVILNRSKTRSPTEIIGYSGYDRINRIDPKAATVHGLINTERWVQDADNIWSVDTSNVDQSILKKCSKNSVPLEECAEFCLGLTPYDKYRGHSQNQIKNKVFHADWKKDDTFRPLLAGNDVTRYLIAWNGNKWISYGPWLGAPRESRFFTGKRILVKQIIDWSSKRIWASIEDHELYNTQNAFNLLAREGWTIEYLLGILNSRLMCYYHRKKYLDEFKMRFQKILIKDCRTFPIPLVKPTNQVHHDSIVILVQQILDLKKRLLELKTSHQRTAMERQISATDRDIDQLVYQLYGLTDKEIAIVEKATEPVSSK